MSKRNQYKARGKVTQKLTRDGLVEHNAATGGDVRISKRSADFDLRGETTDETLLQSETKHGNAQSDNHKRRAVYREANRQAADVNEVAESSPIQFKAAETDKHADRERIADELVNQDVTQSDTEQTPPQNKYDTFRRPPSAKSKPPPNRKPQYQYNAERSADYPPATENTSPTSPADRQHSQLKTENPENLRFERDSPVELPQGKEKHKARPPDANQSHDGDGTDEAVTEKSVLREDKSSKLRFDSEEPEPPPVKPKRHNKADGAAKHETEADKASDTAPRLPNESAETLLHTENTDVPAKPDRQSKLQFQPDEAIPSTDITDTPKLTRNPKLDKAQKQANKTVTKLEAAKAKLPAKKKLRYERVFSGETGKPKRRLYFESEVKSQGEHLKGAKALRPVKTAGNAALAFGHRKMFQVEHENVATEAAHKGEMAAEGIVRSALRHRKLAPYRRAAKLERMAAKKSINLTYQKTLAENPKLQSNILSRAFQKRKIKKDYAKAAREAQKAAKRAKKAGSVAGNAAKVVAGFVRRNPIASIVIVLVGLLLFALMSLIGAFGSMGSGGVGGVVTSTYLAEDAGILAAETAYADMEADLQYELDHYQSLHPGYHEYNFDLDTIWHDPYALISIISALHEGAWTIDEVQDTLTMLFERQYILTETMTSEVRYRPEATGETDPVTGEPVIEQVPYDYYICTVTLENFDLSHLPIYIMGEKQLGRYALLMSTLGNRPDLFPVSAYPNASYYKEYERYDIPPEYFSDATFAAIIAEAEKYLGMPYVWGGSSPATSFDCSGFVSYVLNQSGWNIGRLGATGLYNISTTVSTSEAKPGDLVFFVGTYDTPGISHVGIYVGDGMMLHCGDPIGYASIETSYWQAHFHSFGRVY